MREYAEKDWPEVEALYQKQVEELYGKKDVAGYPKPILAGLYYPLTADQIDFGILSTNTRGEVDGYIVGFRFTPEIFRISDMYVDPSLRGTPTPVIMYNLLKAKLRARFGIKYFIAGISSRQKNINEILDAMGFTDFEVYKFKELE